VPKDSLGILLDRSENVEADEPVETQRDSSGQAPRAGVGDTEGEGEARRPDSWPSRPEASMMPSGEREKRRKDGCACVSSEVITLISSVDIV
jgi:hypothetical protein